MNSHEIPAEVREIISGSTSSPARRQARYLAALMMRNRGPAWLKGGEWQYGWELADCAREVVGRLEP